MNRRFVAVKEVRKFKADPMKSKAAPSPAYRFWDCKAKRAKPCS